MSPSERQKELLKVLCYRRHDTYDNLALEFHVSKRTIRRDVEALMCTYPIDTIRGRYGGGVTVAEGFYLNQHSYKHKSLSAEQITVLKKARVFFIGSDLDTLNSIIVQFAP